MISLGGGDDDGGGGGSDSGQVTEASQQQLAAEVRGLREEVGALAEGLEEAYAERPDQ